MEELGFTLKNIYYFNNGIECQSDVRPGMVLSVLIEVMLIEKPIVGPEWEYESNTL